MVTELNEPADGLDNGLDGDYDGANAPPGQAGIGQAARTGASTERPEMARRMLPDFGPRWIPESIPRKGSPMAEQYIADKETKDAADLMADILILKSAADVIKKWQNPGRPHAAAVAMIECDLMASGLKEKLWKEHGIIA